MEKNTFSSPSYWDSTINWMESVTTKQRNVQIRIESVVLLAWSLLMKGDRVSSHNCLIPVSCLLSHVSCLNFISKNETFTEFHCNLSTVVRFRKNVTSLPHVWIYLCFLSRMQSTFTNYFYFHSRTFWEQQHRKIYHQPFNPDASHSMRLSTPLYRGLMLIVKSSIPATLRTTLSAVSSCSTDSGWFLCQSSKETLSYSIVVEFSSDHLCLESSKSLITFESDLDASSNLIEPLGSPHVDSSNVNLEFWR